MEEKFTVSFNNINNSFIKAIIQKAQIFVGGIYD